MVISLQNQFFRARFGIVVCIQRRLGVPHALVNEFKVVSIKYNACA